MHIHAHTPAHKHTHALTHAGKHPLHVCVFAQTACLSLSLTHPTFLQPTATCRMVEMVTFVASWYDCTSKQSGYVQLPVREDSEKSVDQKDAFGSLAFRNYDLMLIDSLCLFVLSYLICFVQQCYCKWGVFKRQIMWNCYSSVLDYRQFYYGVVKAIHQRCFWMVLADGACGHEKKYVCTRNELLMLHWLAVV